MSKIVWSCWAERPHFCFQSPLHPPPPCPVPCRLACVDDTTWTACPLSSVGFGQCSEEGDRGERRQAEALILVVSFLLGCRLAGSAFLCPRPQLPLLLSISTSLQILVTAFSSCFFWPRKGPQTTLRFDDFLDKLRESTESCDA